MRATEMHDLLADVRAWLRQHVETWRNGENKGFEHIQYCAFCSYSREHGHGENCLLARLESVTKPGADDAV